MNEPESPRSPEHSSENFGEFVADKLDDLRDLGGTKLLLILGGAVLVVGHLIWYLHIPLEAIAEATPLDVAHLYIVLATGVVFGCYHVVARRFVDDSKAHRVTAAILIVGYGALLAAIVVATGVDWPLYLALWFGAGAAALYGLHNREYEHPMGRVVLTTILVGVVVGVPLLEFEEQGGFETAEMLRYWSFVVLTWWGGQLLAARNDALADKRWLENTPRSRARGVMIGDNEVVGEARTGSALTAKYSDRECIYYRSSIEEERERTDDDSGETELTWVTVEAETDACDFVLHDETGGIRVDPEGADFSGTEQVIDEIRPMATESGRDRGSGLQRGTTTGRQRRRESIIPHPSSLYVVGYARIRDDGRGLEIADDDRGRRFEISTKSRNAVIADRAMSVKMYAVLAVIAFVAAPLVAIFENERLYGEPIFIGFSMVVWLAVWLPLAASGPIKVMYNGLVDLVHRKDRARSMLDVEYGRRAALIPRLVEVVEQFAAHEGGVQRALADIRSGGGDSDAPPADAAAASRAIDEQTRCLERLFGLTEDHPDLATDEGFRRLLSELTRCEDKIALARTYFNDSVERLNNRLQTFPDLLLAPLAGINKAEYLEFREFETPPVDLAASAAGLRTSPESAPRLPSSHTSIG